MKENLASICATLLALVSSGCSSTGNATFGPSQGGAQTGSGGAAAFTGGATSNGGTSQLGTGGAHAGGSSSSGGTNQAAGAASSGGATSAGGAGGNGPSSTGGASNGGSDAGAGNRCGSDPCSATRCAGIGCGPAVCCHGPNGPVCIHGASECPAPDGGVVTETLTCWSRSDTSAFAKSCTTERDCFVADHWAGCCHIEAVGLNVTEKDAFTAFEAACGGAPACGCCCDRTTTDDGMTVSSGATVSVACVSGVCTTKTP